jgi:hypothetical protein
MTTSAAASSSPLPRRRWALVPLLGLAGCFGGGFHPPAPPLGALPAVPDPPPSRVVVHTTIFGEAIQKRIEDALPKSGTGSVDVLSGKLEYRWSRQAVALRFDRGRLTVSTKIAGRVEVLGGFTVDLTLGGEPIITPDYKMKLQSVSVDATCDGPLDKVNRTVETRLRDTVSGLLEKFALDTRPLLAAAYSRIAQPIDLALGEAHACAELRVVSVEAGPTVLAQDLEKDIGLVVLPSVTMPCTNEHRAPSALPLLANVASLPSGPFAVELPIAAQYVELSRALEAGIHGRLRHFSAKYPDLYLEKPEVYPSGDAVVVKMILGGSARFGGGPATMTGELYFIGHPRVVDNQITVPDLELTPGSADSLLKLDVLLDGRTLRDEARAALRVDLSERMQKVHDKLSKELTLDQGRSCVRAAVLRSQVTGIYPHQDFLRIYLKVDGQASIYVPCKH